MRMVFYDIMEYLQLRLRHTMSNSNPNSRPTRPNLEAAPQPANVDTARLANSPEDLALAEVDKFVKRHDKVIVLEINRDGQMYGILRKEIATELVPKLYSVAFSDGLPPKATEYAEAIIGTLESF